MKIAELQRLIKWMPTAAHLAEGAGLPRGWGDRLINGGKVKHHWQPLWQGISSHMARHMATTLLRQISKNNKALAKRVFGHAEEVATDR